MHNPACSRNYRTILLPFVTIALAIAFLTAAPLSAQQTPVFTPGNLVVVVEGCGVHGGTCTAVPNGAGTGGSYGDNQAAPITLFQYTPTGTASVTFVNSLIFPQTGSVANFPVSGEYGSSSEGTMHLSGQGEYLTMMGYGINANTFNASPTAYGSNDPSKPGALAQSVSLNPNPAGQQPPSTSVPRVVTLIDPFGKVNSSTVLYNVFNVNNPRSVFTADGTTAYVSGQGSGCDATGGVFYTPLFVINSTPTAITGIDAGTNPPNCLPAIAQDTRDIQIITNTSVIPSTTTLYVSVDSKEGHSNNRSFIGTLGTPPATSLFTPPLPQTSGYTTGPAQIPGLGNSGGTGKVTVTACAATNGNPINCVNSTTRAINMSPVNYFFASPSVLYVADSGFPKNDSNGDDNSTSSSNIGDGGLQKWVNSSANGSGTWSLKYTLYQGLNLVNNGSASGTTGLYGLAGTVSGSSVLLYATNYAIGDLDQTYLYGITDTLSNTTPPLATLAFTLLDTAPADSKFRGLAFAPTVPTGGVEIASSPSGLAFTSSGVGCGPAPSFPTPQIMVWTPSSTCTLNVTTPQSGGTGVQYAFTQWDNGTSINTNPMYTVTAPSSPAIYTATFTTQYLLTTSAGTGGTVSAGGFIDSGTNANITATPSAGYYFVNFTDSNTSAVISASNPLSLPMNGPQSVTANFAPQLTATISVIPYSLPYDANAHTATGTATGAAGVDLSADLTLSSTTHANAGTYATDGWSFHDPSGMYADASSTVSDAIQQVNANITVTPYNAPYDTAEHAAGAKATGVGNVDLSADLDLSHTKHTNANSYSADYWTFTDASGNYNNVAATTITDVITKVDASITVTPYNAPYDTTEHTAGGTAMGVGGVDLSADLDLSHTKHTNANAYSADYWTFTDASGNYNNVAATTITDTITKVNASITVTPYNAPYDANPHTAGGTAMGVGGVNLSADLNLNGTTHTNAGNYTTDFWTFTDPGGNYNNVAATTITDSIAKAPASITISNIPVSATIGGNFTVSYAYTGDGIPSVTSSTAGCTVSGGVVNFVGAGLCTLTAHATAGTNYAAANGTPQSIEVNLNGNLTISSGQAYTFANGNITGNITMTGGTLTLDKTTVGGNLQMSGGTLVLTDNSMVKGNLQISGASAFSIGPGQINGNLQIQNIPSGLAQNQICGAKVNGNLQYQNNGTAVAIGSPSCSGNTIGGNLQVTNNTAAAQVDKNIVGGNLQVQNNSASTAIFTNMAKGNLQCSGNNASLITGDGNTAATKQGQCAGF